MGKIRKLSFTHPEFGEIHVSVVGRNGRQQATAMNATVNGHPITASGYTHTEAGANLVKQMAAAEQAGTLRVNLPRHEIHEKDREHTQ